MDKKRLETLFLIVFLLGVFVGFLAHDHRDSIEINNAAKNLVFHPLEYQNITFLIPDDIYIIRNDTNGSK